MVILLIAQIHLVSSCVGKSSFIIKKRKRFCFQQAAPLPWNVLVGPYCTWAHLCAGLAETRRVWSWRKRWTCGSGPGLGMLPWHLRASRCRWCRHGSNRGEPCSRVSAQALLGLAVINCFLFSWPKWQPSLLSSSPFPALPPSAEPVFIVFFFFFKNFFNSI